MNKKVIKKKRNLPAQSINTLKKFKVIEAEQGNVNFQMNNPNFVDIKSVHLWKENPRFNEKAIAPLAALFLAHGIRSHIVVWKKNNVIYKGNTSYKALLAIGCPVVSVDYQDFESEAAAAAYGLADNKSSELAQWDKDVLLTLMNAKEMNPHKANTGFRESELERMIKEQAGSVINPADTGKLPAITIQYHPRIKSQLIAVLKKKIALTFKENVLIKY